MAPRCFGSPPSRVSIISITIFCKYGVNVINPVIV